MDPKKRKIGNCAEETMKEAVNLVREGGSLRKVASLKDIPFQTLARYVNKARDVDDISQIRMSPNYSINKVFTSAEEDSLENYIISCSRMFYGLSVDDCRKLAYEMAIENKKKIPAKWHERKMAGLKWMRGFRQRHVRLSLRTPEGCSLSRATSFNRHNVSIFYQNMKNIYSRTDAFADGRRIYNLDETATTTVQKSAKVVAEKGVKQVSKVTSGERGTLVTTCCIISATGQYLPPAMVFPRVHLKEHMLRGSPSGTLGLAAPSGWMNADLFLEVMKHFIKYSNSSKENPSFLIYDNHESHLSIRVLNLAKDNGVTILTFPPHSTNKMQPLDVGVFKAFSTCYNASVDTWMMQHPGKPFTIYEVAECVGFAHEKALTPSNIINAFKKCGIYPYDANVFTDIDFLPSAVTDRDLKDDVSQKKSIDLPSTSTSTKKISVSDNIQENISDIENDATLDTSIEKSNQQNDKNGKTVTDVFKSPAEFKGFPKAGERKTKNTRRKGKSIIATDTPEKDAIEERSITKKRKIDKIEVKKVGKVKKQIFEDSSESSEEELELGSSSGDDCSYIINPDGFEELHRKPIENDFVLVEFPGKLEKKKVYYVGKVLKINESEEYEISYLRKQTKGTSKFVFPNIPDEAIVALKDIKLIMPPPIPCGHTSRQTASFTFEIDFGLMDIR